MTVEDIKLVIQAYFKVNKMEGELHGQEHLYQYSLTEGYWEQILVQYLFMKDEKQVPNLEKASNESKY